MLVCSWIRFCFADHATHRHSQIEDVWLHTHLHYEGASKDSKRICEDWMDQEGAGQQKTKLGFSRRLARTGFSKVDWGSFSSTLLWKFPLPLSRLTPDTTLFFSLDSGVSVSAGWDDFSLHACWMYSPKPGISGPRLRSKCECVRICVCVYTRACVCVCDQQHLLHAHIGTLRVI